MSEPTWIAIAPALPCATLVAVQKRCERPASVASAWKMHGGSWQIQPMCALCAAALAKVYGVDTITDNEELA